MAHLPARTPYARKLTDHRIAIVNQAGLGSSESAPRDMSFAWLKRQPNFDFFDVLHIHSVELAELDDIRQVITRCRQAGKAVVATIHDITPMFDPTHDQYALRLRTLASLGVPMTTLTHGAAEQLRLTANLPQLPLVIPHGFVLSPDDPRFRRHSQPSTCYSFGLYGGFRPNRTMHTPVANLMYGSALQESTIGIYTRALSPIELSTNDDVKSVVGAATAHPSRVTLRMDPFPDDDAIVDFVLSTGILVLPYLWSTHSGQLELAFDLGITPVVADVGHLREQWTAWGDLVPAPIWFDASNAYGFGSQLLEAMTRALRQAPGFETGSAFAEHRRREHREILDSLYLFYCASMPEVGDDFR